MNKGTYITITLMTTVVFVAVTMCANYVLDPLMVFRSESNPDKVQKPAFEKNVRLAKAHIVQRLKPSAAVLGSSRAEIGLNPGHPGWGDKLVFNSGLPSASIAEMSNYLEHLQLAGGLQLAVVGLDLFQFNPDKAGSPDFRECRLNQGRYPELVNSLRRWCDIPYLWISPLGYQQLAAEHSDAPIPSVYLANGSRGPNAKDWEIRKLGSQLQLFEASEQEYRSKAGLYDGLADIGDFANSPVSKAFTEILTFAHQNEIDTRFIISPSHARQWETIHAMKLWPTFEDWKRFLVSANQQVAREHSRDAFPIWDFADYNNFSTEPVPEDTADAPRMKWYWESSHYTKQLGDIVLNKVLLEDNIELGKEIGSLTDNELEAWLAIIIQNRELWLESTST